MNKKYNITATYLNMTIEFEVEAENIIDALREGKLEAQEIFIGAVGNIIFWNEKSSFHVKEKS